MTIDTGDSVLHIPTGERWLVACVQNDRLSWMGWPEGTAELSDCRLIEKASPKERYDLLVRLAKVKGDDHRKRYAQRVLEGEPT